MSSIILIFNRERRETREKKIGRTRERDCESDAGDDWMSNIIFIFNHGTHRKHGMKRVFNRERRETREKNLKGLKSGIAKAMREMIG